MMVRDCAAGGLSPALAANVSNSGDTANVGTGLTVNVTGTGMGLLEAPGLSTMTVPEYVPADSPAGFAEMLIALGDTPPAAAYTMLSTPVPASTISWSVEMIDAAAALGAPSDAWYLLRSVGEDVREGYSVQNMSLWAQDGTLIMLARQHVAIFG